MQTRQMVQVLLDGWKPQIHQALLLVEREVHAERGSRRAGFAAPSVTVSARGSNPS